MDDVPSPYFHVGALLKETRLKRQLSARRVSAMAGLSAGYVTKVETGEINPTLKAFSRMAKVLRLTPQEVWFVVRSVAEER